MISKPTVFVTVYIYNATRIDLLVNFMTYVDLAILANKTRLFGSCQLRCLTNVFVYRLFSS